MLRRNWTIETPSGLVLTPPTAGTDAATWPAPAEDETAENCIRWIHRNCQLVSDTGKGLIPFSLYDYQEDVIRALFLYREVIVCKARQLGLTELIAAYIVYRLRWPHRTALLLSRGKDAAGEALVKARTAWANLPEKERVPALNRQRTSTLELQNGSRLLPQPATESAGRTFNAQFLVLDEWAHQEFQAEIFAAAAPTMSAGNQIIGLSSANGVGNEFHRQWELAQQGGGMHPIFLPWHVRPGRTQEWYDQTTRTYEGWQKAQEFPTTPDEAFVLSGRPRFDGAALSEIARGTQEPLEVIPLGVSAEGHTAGFARVWGRPVPGQRYVCGADPAEGLVKGDYSAAVILDWSSGVEMVELHGHWEPEEFARHLADVCRAYNGAYLGVERNNHGHAVLLALSTLHQYPALYAHQEYDQHSVAGVPRLGWATTAKSKPLMIDALAETIRERRPYRNALFVSEARTYAVQDNGATGASGSMHDDRIMSYSIAEMLRRFAPPEERLVDLSELIGEDYRVRINEHPMGW